MRAAFYRSFGDAAEVLEVGELDKPDPADGEVLVRIVVSAVNPTDWKARRGSRPMTFPFVIPNQDGSGVIEAVGPGVDEARVGQNVWVYFAASGRQYGTAAEYTVVPSDRAVPLPDGASMDLGASMGVPALTAHRALFWDGPVDGQTILVSGGAGAVGHYAIELAKDGGARVITTVSTAEKATLAAAAGADVVVNYRDSNAADQILDAAPGGVNRIVEVALGENMELDSAVLAPHGTIVTYAKTAHDPEVNVIKHMMGNHTLRFMMLYDAGTEAIAAGVAAITDCLERRVLTELPAHRFELSRIVAAHEACEARVVGKVLIDT
ncbi:MAG: NADPH:quinone reductase [Acidimicrobiia bacterium]|nr:NADPH:quinone reductase [Acidimicrobiia bacterium]MDH5503358.1 NADPH:quinone reductase [Acidimicrobiia bacterium]